MPFNPNSILVWAQVGQQLVQIGRTEFSGLQAAMAAKGVEADTAQLQKVGGLYDARIARREEEIAAGRPTNDTGD